MQTLRNHGAWGLDDVPLAMSWSTDGRYLAAGSAAGTVLVVDSQAGAETCRFRAHDHGLLALAFRPSHHTLLTTGQDGAARLWAPGVDGARLIDSTQMPDVWVGHAAWQPAGELFAVSSGRTARVFDAKGTLLREYVHPRSTIAGLAWKPVGAQIALAGYGSLLIVSPQDERSPGRRLDYRGSLINVSWRPAGDVIACGCQDSTVHFWRLGEGRDSYMSGYETKPTVLAWSRDGAWLGTNGSSDLTLWSFRKGGPEGSSPVTLRAHRSPVRGMAFLGRGRRLVSGCAAGVVCVWDRFEDFVPPVLAERPGAAVEIIQNSPHSSRGLFAVADAEGIVHLLEAP